MGAIAGIVGSALSATGQSGMKGDMQQNNVSQTASVSNTGNNAPDIKEAKVEKAAEPVGGTTETKAVEAPKAEGAGAEKIDWKKLSRLADELTAPQGSPAPITANSVANTQSIANFR